MARQAIVVLATVGFAVALAVAPGGAVSPAAAATAPIDQCNGVYNAAAAQVECRVEIVNTLDLGTGVGSSVVTITECIGAPAAVTCGLPVVTNYTDVTTTVNQCNGSGNSGGSFVTCSVSIENVITGVAATREASVNQCAGSGAGGGELPLNCDYYETTSDATITQCNDSVNGGGAPLRVVCSVGASTETDAIDVTVNQCNGSANGGGALMYCTTSLVNRGTGVTAPAVVVRPIVPIAAPVYVAPPVVVAPVAAPVAAAPVPTLAATGGDVQLPALLGLLALVAGASLTAWSLRRTRSAQRAE